MTAGLLPPTIPPSGCEDACIYTGPGTYKCGCSAPHAFLDLDNKTCACSTGYSKNLTKCDSITSLFPILIDVEINLCEKKNGECEDRCTPNGPGLRLCSCLSTGAFLERDGKTCGCSLGYVKNGTYCTEVDLCNTNPKNGDCEDKCTKIGPGRRQCTCEDPNAVLNLDNTTCSCKPGYNKTGTSCPGT